jgi:ketopantoate reductase
MRVDLERGRQTEVEPLYVAVIDRAEAADIDVPVLRTLADLIRLAERGSSAD